MCLHSFLIEPNCFKVCKFCGLQNGIHIECDQTSCGYIQTHSPFTNGYSRKKRFSNIVESLIHPTPCKSDRIMLEHFVTNSIKCKVSEIENILRISKLRDKRYHSMHLFSRLFAIDYIAPKRRDTLLIMRRLMFDFERLEFAFVKQYSNQKPFLNYNWILLHLLKLHKLFEFMKFVKKIKCQKRLEYYQGLVDSLHPPI